SRAHDVARRDDHDHTARSRYEKNFYLVSPDLGQGNDQPRKQGWLQLCVALAGLVDAVFFPFEDQTCKRFSEGVENPIVGDAGPGVPAALQDLIVLFVPHADRLDQQSVSSTASALGTRRSDRMMSISKANCS